ncbi:hypothetical protein ACHAXR_008834 [Thalassiosira sp. AJA248-18]
MPLLRKLFIIHSIATIACLGSAFVPPSSPKRPVHSLLAHPPTTKSLPLRSSPSRISTTLHESQSDSNDDLDNTAYNNKDACWNPNLRKQLAAISSLGLLETAYLTYDKIQYSSVGKASSLVGALCSDNSASSCNDVLHGPYASVHLGGLNLPLSALGMAAYTTVFLLAALPLISSESDSGEVVLDGNNRVALLGGTTLMASFSVYLVSLLLGVLHASCLFCFVSAGLSVMMAALSWFGGMLPNSEEELSGEEGALLEVMELRKRGATLGASSVGAATVVALGLFLGASDNGGNFDTLAASSATASSSSGTLLASTGSTKIFTDNVPPAITTTSSASALTLASDLKSLNSRMFGAFWCSHCYDQKQSLGYEAMQVIPYVECDQEGYNNKRALCKERGLPGYPTWEIGGELFPGERSLEELREIVDDVKAGK